MTQNAQPRSRQKGRGWAQQSSPFNLGEQRVQSRVGVREQVERAGRNMIREELADPQRALFEALPMLVVASMDRAGRPWASILAGQPGFVRSQAPKSLSVTAELNPGDPLLENLHLGGALGLLGIQLEARLRTRANGHISALDSQSFTLEVEQSFGNCKQYIQAREPTFDRTLRAEAGRTRQESAQLSERASALLLGTDTLFIATASAAADTQAAGEGVDISHRGGRPGFVRVRTVTNGSLASAAPGTRAAADSPENVRATHTQLTLPDFTGNFMFNTLGNLEENPRAGIVCADFETGDILCVTGSACVIWSGPEVESFAGAERLLSFDVESGVLLERALALRFTRPTPSPYLATTGTWTASADTTDAD
jgi:predicted pyridoxine 5'-phosphate oxidase superfamily flavin-nucleotide-binding protein